MRAHFPEQRLVIEPTLLPSADFSNQRSLISIEDPRPVFSDSGFKPAYSMMWRLRASRDECLLFMDIRIHLTSKKTHGSIPKI